MSSEPQPQKVFVDFDHTLLAANSTELFVAYCRPSLVVAVLEFLIRKVFPWKLLIRERPYRLADYALFVTLACLTPWNLMRWRRSAPGVFEAKRSAYVDDLIGAADPCDIVIVSFGMRAIIAPMLRHSKLAGSMLMATPDIATLSHFRDGKSDIVQRDFDLKTIADAKFITDSDHDQDLLDIVTDGNLIPPQGEINNARHALYLPMRYTLAAKYPKGYSLDQLLFVDMLLIVVGSANSLQDMAWLFVVAPLMMMSFMCVYEIGYYENDFVGVKREKKPSVTASIEAYRSYPIRLNAWIWALVLGFCGIAAARYSDLLLGSLQQSMTVWITALLISRGTFFVYNRQKVDLRLFSYILLQAEKYGLVFLIIDSTLIGVMMICSQIFTMWIIYIVYRLGGRREEIQRELIRVTLFLLLAAMIYVSDSHSFDGEGFAAGLILIWSLLRLAKGPVMKKLRG